MPSALELLFRDTVAALSAEALTCSALARGPAWLRDSRPVVLALGKAAVAMARGAASLAPRSGVVASNQEGPLPPGLTFVRGSHPVPDASSEAAGRALLEAAARARPEENVLFLISGGGSAIAAVPAPGVTLEAKAETTKALLRSGASIEEMNAVRKHLSAIKGGQLKAACAAKRSLALVLCDVPSGALSSVASGPTVGDDSTFAQCLDIAAAHDVKLPPLVGMRLALGAGGGLPETPKPSDPRLEVIEHVRLAIPGDLARTACRLATERGLRAEAHLDALTADVETVAQRIAEAVEQGGRGLFAFAGEPSVQLPSGAGSGGRMQQLALLLAHRFAGRPVQILCAGSDGRDGDSPHAGALVDGETWSLAQRRGIDLASALERFDSAPVHAALGTALPAFDSGTNLCDLVLVNVA